MGQHRRQEGDTPFELAESIVPHHHRVDPENWENLYVVGDVHGCLETFERLLSELGVSADDLVVCVGDLIRKGPDSKGVLSLVRERDNIRSVRGNNEQGLLDGSKSDPALDEDDLAYIETLPLAISFDDALVVHGGLDHREPLTDHDPEDILEMRSLTGGGYDRPYWFENRTETPRVFFGHTVLSEAFATPAAVGLDTGCVYGGQLTAYDWNDDEFVSVDPAETYKERSSDSIVDPRPAAPLTE
ncbi:metallophosphoesterase family protein [Salinibaculum rarum]|uniref:metallophosphoesterase family protein n=1 Tax=Salinibaculum rarum TaxID=3058903 RepID=UPI00265E85AF|nr:metallophosphoesterase family protein [Salinibaculum sp. KK48]